MADHTSNTESMENLFKLTKEMKLHILRFMSRLKPTGINKHINMLFLQQELCKKFEADIPTKCIWDFLFSSWNIDNADEIEGIHFNVDQKNFTLPEEYHQLIIEEGEKIEKVQMNDLKIDDGSVEASNNNNKPEEKEQYSLVKKKLPNQSIDFKKCKKVPGIRRRTK